MTFPLANLPDNTDAKRAVVIVVTSPLSSLDVCSIQNRKCFLLWKTQSTKRQRHKVRHADEGPNLSVQQSEQRHVKPCRPKRFMNMENGVARIKKWKKQKQVVSVAVN